MGDRSHFLAWSLAQCQKVNSGNHGAFLARSEHSDSCNLSSDRHVKSAAGIQSDMRMGLMELSKLKESMELLRLIKSMADAPPAAGARVRTNTGVGTGISPGHDSHEYQETD